MFKTIIDLSLPIENGVASDPPGFSPEITYLDHKETLPEIKSFFPGLRDDDLPDGEGWSYERLNLVTHNGTHLDAPYHFATTMDGGKRAITIDEIPLSWCFRPGIKLDFRHFDDGYVISRQDVIDEIRASSY